MIKCCPSGLKEAGNGEYLSISLVLRTKSTIVRAIFKASVLGRHGKSASETACSVAHVFTTNCKGGGINSYGWPRFAKRVELEAKYLTEGRVTFLCHVLVVNDNSIPLPPPREGSHLSKLLDEMEGADVSFTTNGHTFHAHRAVLAARSPVFKARFFGPGAEATSSNISSDGIEPATFKVFLNFIYTDALPGDDGLGRSPPVEMFHHLFAAADKYALYRLKLICAQKLCENMSPDSIATTLDVAERYDCLELKARCIDFLVADGNFSKVVLTEGFSGTFESAL